MAEQITNSEGTARVDPRIQLMLRALRRRVRIYIWIEGITLGLIWLALTFWFGFAIDYLPVLIGANELSRGIRAGLLVIVAVMLGVILYRWILRRTFVRLSDRNMVKAMEAKTPPRPGSSASTSDSRAVPTLARNPG